MSILNYIHQLFRDFKVHIPLNFLSQMWLPSFLLPKFWEEVCPYQLKISLLCFPEAPGNISLTVNRFCPRGFPLILSVDTSLKHYTVIVTVKTCMFSSNWFNSPFPRFCPHLYQMQITKNSTECMTVSIFSLYCLLIHPPSLMKIPHYLPK